MPRHPTSDDAYTGGPIQGAKLMYEGMELGTPKHRITFGEDVLCPTCGGKRVAVPMSRAEARTRRAHMMRYVKAGSVGEYVPPDRWLCERCNGEGIVGLND